MRFLEVHKHLIQYWPHDYEMIRIKTCTLVINPTWSRSEWSIFIDRSTNFALIKSVYIWKTRSPRWILHLLTVYTVKRSFPRAYILSHPYASFAALSERQDETATSRDDDARFFLSLFLFASWRSQVRVLRQVAACTVFLIYKTPYHLLRRCPPFYRRVTAGITDHRHAHACVTELIKLKLERRE